MNIHSIQFRLLIWPGIALFIVATVIIAIGVVSTYTLSEKSAKERVIASALEVENKIHHQIEYGFNAAKTVAHMLQMQVDPKSKTKFTREQVHDMVRQVLSRTPQVIGMGSQWIANGFDGRDVEYQNTPTHDHTGIFIPYWYRAPDGSIVIEAIQDYEGAIWWTVPYRSRKPSIIEPYFYKVGAQNVLMVTFSVPIIHNNKFYAITTSDIKIDFLQNLVKQYDAFGNRATVVLISSAGKILASNQNGDFRGKDAKKLYPQFTSLIKQADKKSILTDKVNGQMMMLSRIDFNGVDESWFLGFEIPESEIVSSAKKVAIKQLIPGIISILMGLFLFWILLRKLTKRISEAATLAHKIRDGDLTPRLNIQGSDEISELGAALDAMVEALQKRTQELIVSRQNMAITLDAIGDAVIVTDQNGCITRMNPVAERITGWGSDEAVGLPLGDVFIIVNTLTKEEIENPAERVLQQKEISYLPGNTTLINKDQHEYIIADSAAPIQLDSGEMIGVVIVFRDITGELKLQEQFQQSQKLDAIGHLAGGVAHDFNNMLGGIMGMSELLKLRHKDDPKTQKQIKTILKTSERAANLASKLLAFSRRQAPISTLIDLHKIITDVCALLSNTIDKMIVIEASLSAEVSTVVGDDSQLQNVFLNLGINAAHAMPEGGKLIFQTTFIKLSDRYCATSSFELIPGEYIEIMIIDTGFGIPPETIQHIFEPFFTTKEVGKGTGLGLAAAYGTVTQHKGEITVESVVGKGTTFRILLPVSRSGERNQPVLQEISVRGTGKILLVDDEALLRETGQALLIEMGYDVFLAENGADAVEVFRNNVDSIDLVILDMIMPVMNGRNCFIELRKIRPDIPVVLCSGFSRSEDLEDLIKQGLNKFIRKPYRGAELSEVVSEILSGKK